MAINILAQIGLNLKKVLVFPRLIKSPYKMYSLNIPYFMRVRKRFDAKKIRKIGWILDILAIFSEAWYCQNGYIPPKIHGR